MSARIPPGFAEVWVQFGRSDDPEPMYIALGVNLAAGVGASQAAADSILAAVPPGLDNMISTDYGIGPGHVIFGQDGGDIRIDGTATPVAGTQAGTALPQNCAVLFRKLTAVGGRRGRGRGFIPGIPEGNVTPNGSLTTAYRTTAIAAVQQVLTDLVATAEVTSLQLFHDTAPFQPTLITSLEVQPVIATQRRRLRP